MKILASPSLSLSASVSLSVFSPPFVCLCVSLSLTHLGELNYAFSLSFYGTCSLPSSGTYLIPLHVFISVMIAACDYQGHRLPRPSSVTLQTLRTKYG